MDYRLGASSEEMKVVGHFEQMRLSRCYQQSDSLTCTTCHNSHETVAPEKAAASDRNKCLSCHAPAACGLALDVRTKTKPIDNCAACHMPQSPTDIPHIAFTHHRIGIHRAQAESTAASPPPPGAQQFAELTPLLDGSHLPEIERDRCLGLAYLEISGRHQGPASRHYRSRAAELLETVRRRGLRDAHVDAGLARLYYVDNAPRAVELALAALADEPLPPSERINALSILAVARYQTRQWAPAQSALEQLILLRRQSSDWLLLGLCQEAQGDDHNAVLSLRRALEINPYRPEVHEQLAKLCERQHQPEQAERHRKLASLLADRERVQSKRD